MRTVPLGLTTQIAAGAAAASLIALVANRAGALTNGGMVAAVLVGGSAVAAGWSWGVVLVFFFVSSTALSRLGAGAKQARAGGIVAKSGARDAVQVAANGGVFAMAAVAFAVASDASAAAAGMGALAAATSDTWATELGMLSGATPRSIVTWRTVPVGTSGGVSMAGMLAASGGAVAIAVASALLGIAPGMAMSVAVGGIGGAVIDSVLGASLQSQRHCARCDAPTERTVHSCGSPTEHVRGWTWIGNDAVNAMATVFGAGVAVALHLSTHRV